MTAECNDGRSFPTDLDLSFRGSRSGTANILGLATKVRLRGIDRECHANTGSSRAVSRSFDRPEVIPRTTSCRDIGSPSWQRRTSRHAYACSRGVAAAWSRHLVRLRRLLRIDGAIKRRFGSVTSQLANMAKELAEMPFNPRS